MRSDLTLNVFHIQRYSLHDGSGIRTTVFLKGCPLRCRWCCNPESQHRFRELMYAETKCIGRSSCGLCEKICPVDAISFTADGIALPDRSRCVECQRCAESCPSQALHTAGKGMNLQDILAVAVQDAAFYRHGGGGLTLSGGEPLLQEAAVTLLQEAKDAYLQTSIETCGFVPETRLLGAAQYLDEVYYDVKSMDDDKHRLFTGESNALILSNLRALTATFPHLPVTVRTPVIPGFNEDDGNLAAIEHFVRSLGGNVQWETLPYHTFGAAKYKLLGRVYEMAVGS